MNKHIKYGKNENRKIKSNMKKEGGITLVALVVTIVVLLLLAGISISLVLGQNGIISKAQEGGKQYGEASMNEQVLLNETAKYIDNINKEDTDQKEVKISDIFQKEREDEVGYDVNKLHVGDFINYDAGTWTSSEINAIKTGTKGSEVTANGTRDLPTTWYQFGGFAVGDSRNGNAVSYSSTYLATSEGWRIFDVADNGAVTLISAGNPEDYYHPYGDNYGYNSEYILTGTENSYASSSNFTARNWSMYVNSSQYAISSTPLTKTRLDQWYDRYMGTTNADVYTNATFQLIYGKKYESLIDSYSCFWLSSTDLSDIGNISYMFPGNRRVLSSYHVAYGIRPLVTLKADTKVDAIPSTQSVTSRGNNYSYKVWRIK